MLAVALFHVAEQGDVDLAISQTLEESARRKVEKPDFRARMALLEVSDGRGHQIVQNRRDKSQPNRVRADGELLPDA